MHRQVGRPNMQVRTSRFSGRMTRAEVLRLYAALLRHASRETPKQWRPEMVERVRATFRERMRESDEERCVAAARDDPPRSPLTAPARARRVAEFLREGRDRLSFVSISAPRRRPREQTGRSTFVMRDGKLVEESAEARGSATDGGRKNELSGAVSSSDLQRHQSLMRRQYMGPKGW